MHAKATCPSSQRDLTAVVTYQNDWPEHFRASSTKKGCFVIVERRKERKLFQAHETTKTPLSCLVFLMHRSFGETLEAP